jgi:hypothetical protein
MLRRQKVLCIVKYVMLRVFRVLRILVIAVSSLWPFTAWLAERAPDYHGESLPGCGVFVLPEYRQAAARARLQMEAIMTEREIPGAGRGGSRAGRMARRTGVR